MLWAQKTLFGCLRTPNSRHKKIYLGNENGLSRENYALKSRMETRLSQTKTFGTTLLCSKILKHLV
jgi:hypothetical protein